MHRFILYLSRLASDQGGEVFDSVCRIAPERNRRAGISAILLFDGQWFCQLIAGEGVRVRELLTTILLDERHIDMQLLADEAQDVTSGLHCWANARVAPSLFDELLLAETDAPMALLALFASTVGSLGSLDLNGDAQSAGQLTAALSRPTSG